MADLAKILAPLREKVANLSKAYRATDACLTFEDVREFLARIDAVEPMLSRRDVFAAAALQAVGGSVDVIHRGGTVGITPAADVAARAVELADALIAAQDNTK